MKNQKKIMNRIHYFFALLLMISGVFLCAKKEVKAAPKPKSMTIKTDIKTIDIKGKTQVTVSKVKPSSASRKVIWKSSNKKIATVNSKGVVTGRKKGTVKITAISKKNKKLKKSIKIKVRDLRPISIQLNSGNIQITKENRTRLQATLLPHGLHSRGVTWNSGNSDIVTVDQNGNLYGKEAGTATITCTAKEKGSTGKTILKKITVTVNRKKVNLQYMSISETLRKKANNEIIVLDVRQGNLDNSGTAVGYDAGHITGAIWCPAHPVETKEEEQLLTSSYVMQQLQDNNKPIVVVCKSGKKGAPNAISVLYDKGINESRLYVMTGGGIGLVEEESSQITTGHVTLTDTDVSMLELNVFLSVQKALTSDYDHAIWIDARSIDSTQETVKGAKTLSWKDLSRQSNGAGSAGYGTLDTLEETQKKLGDAGLSPDDTIVLFSDGYEKNGWGEDGRIAWHLIQCGFRKVYVVNGGLKALKKAGASTQIGPSPITKKSVTISNVNGTKEIDTQTIHDKKNEYKIIDVRSNTEYNGSTLYEEKRGGHITGAIHIRFTDLFYYDGTLKSKEELIQLFHDAGVNESEKIVLYGTSGVRSAYMQLVMQACGFEQSANYSESIYRWAAMPASEYPMSK